jgi:hypothetical protein
VRPGEGRHEDIVVHPRVGELTEGIIEIPELVEIEHLGFVIAHAADDGSEIGRWPSLASPKAGSGSVIMMRLKLFLTWADERYRTPIVPTS